MKGIKNAVFYMICVLVKYKCMQKDFLDLGDEHITVTQFSVKCCDQKDAYFYLCIIV